MQPLRPVNLYGFLGEKYGEHHMLAVSSPAEAIKLFTVNYPDFARDMIDSKDNGVFFRVTFGGAELDPSSELHMEHQDETAPIDIAPVISGNAKGAGKVALGVVLIAASIFYGPQLATAGYAMVAPVGISIGLSLTMSGMALLLAKDPQRGPKDGDKAGSYTFTGAANTARQGTPIPLGFGKFMTGSLVASVNITTRDL